MPGVLYVVSTPIGNPDDLTLRALRVLREVQWIASEDPASTGQLLSYHAIDTPLTAYHNVNKDEKIPVLMAKLLGGDNLALVSDAGTPVIFDPGAVLISQAQTSGIRVVPIPGPSAPITAAAVSGFSIDGLIIQGFLPRGSAPQRQFLDALQEERRTVILLIRPRRLRPTLKALCVALGTRRLALAKNLTMPDEEVLRGTTAELLERTDQRVIQGELTLVIEGNRGKRARGRDAELKD
ncbi:MAG TPA: 16S rRNA (cytidine(1402)-2'-O)-methyltransferase [Nitrospiraceae bacterium]|nr:16S rRNA (cytidine(1402)-2'-O)-methyltransferase [Nitrospiraceae bacterium]